MHYNYVIYVAISPLLWAGIYQLQQTQRWSALPTVQMQLGTKGDYITLHYIVYYIHKHTSSSVSFLTLGFLRSLFLVGWLGISCQSRSLRTDDDDATGTSCGLELLSDGLYVIGERGDEESRSLNPRDRLWLSDLTGVDSPRTGRENFISASVLTANCDVLEESVNDKELEAMELLRRPALFLVTLLVLVIFFGVFSLHVVSDFSPSFPLSNLIPQASTGIKFSFSSSLVETSSLRLLPLSLGDWQVTSWHVEWFN